MKKFKSALLILALVVGMFGSSFASQESSFYVKTTNCADETVEYATKNIHKFISSLN